MIERANDQSDSKMGRLNFNVEAFTRPYSRSRMLQGKQANSVKTSIKRPRNGIVTCLQIQLTSDLLNDTVGQTVLD
jgi:hypothetical protein